MMGRGKGVLTGMLCRSMLVFVLGVLEELRPIMPYGCSCFSGVLIICAPSPAQPCTTQLSMQSMCPDSQHSAQTHVQGSKHFSVLHVYKRCEGDRLKCCGSPMRC